MTPDEYWKKALNSKVSTPPLRKFKVRRFYYDFDWKAFYPEKKDTDSSFRGMKVVGEIIKKEVPDTDGTNVVVILTLDGVNSLRHEKVNGIHYFVFNAEKLKNPQTSYTTTFLGSIANGLPIDVYQHFKQSPEQFRKAMLSEDTHSAFLGLKQEEAESLLPNALEFISQTLVHDNKRLDNGERKNKELEMLTRALQLLLAQVQSRGDISAIFSVLDGLSKEHRLYLQSHPEVVKQVVESDITSIEVTAWAYRKQQLQFFEEKLASKDVPEADWQAFFEKNQWIFGYGLDYVYLSSLNDRKLEQIVQGNCVSGFGKRVDALMKTRGVISHLCFLEIKTNETALLQSAQNPYRIGCWAPSSELAGAVAQVQVTVASALDTIKGKLFMTEINGDPTGEIAFNYAPKAYLIIGNLAEFSRAHGINEEKYRSFELFRRNTKSPEIVTFDELYERAKFIIQVATS